MDFISGLKYSYTLWVNGKSFTSFIQEQSKILETWIVRIGEKKYKVILDKNLLSVWMNGEEIQVEVFIYSFIYDTESVADKLKFQFLIKKLISMKILKHTREIF